MDVLRTVSRRRLLAGGVVLLGLSVTEGFGVIMLLPLLEIVGVDAGQGAPGRMSAAVTSLFAAAGVRPTLATVLGVYVGIAALQGALQRWQALLSTGIEQDIVTAMRRRVYRAIAGVQWTFFARHRSSDFTHVLTEEVDRAGGAVYSLIDLLVAAAIVLVYFGISFRVSPAVATAVALCGLSLALVMRRRLVAARTSGEQVSQSARGLYAAIIEHLGSMKTTMSYAAVERHAGIFGRLSDEVRSARVRAAGEHGRFRHMVALGSTAGLAIIVYVSLAVLSISTAELLVLLFVVARLMPRLTGLHARVQALARELPAFAVVRDLETCCAAAARPRFDRPQPVNLHREIRLEGVTFRYGAGLGVPAVRGVDLTILVGSTTAIVGPSGAGKSTIADLLLGLIAPDEGRLLIDGEPLVAERIESWQRQIGYVPQDTFLFHDSVRANLLWAAPDAADEHLWHALRLAAADRFVAALPQGIQTVLGDRGSLLSGGERQRISLARALLRNPRLLILDEATSSLDAESEARIQQAIDSLHRRMTIVIITHRLSAIRHADMIHVLDRGRLVETGTWQELHACPTGRFRKMWCAQGLGQESAAGAAAERRTRRIEAVSR